ncbi:amino acid ABC transporter ATP-binding protein [Actinomycetaceae bacterium MB13-C1-2]|nr:amino acid ABC transporter ATP-binding protein [Actinomycetaceae bacterium MB13-C1-2]
MRIELENLHKSFGEQQVLCGINFDEDVSTLALIGPSGGGKSTLLRTVGGLEEPSSGTVKIQGTQVDYRASSLPAYRASLGFVFQHSGLFDHLNAIENIALPLRTVHGVSEEDAREQSHALLDRFGLSEVATKHPAQLSGGERQRVAIARAIAPRPQLLLLDEPTSALDPEYTAEVLGVINDLKQEGTRFIIVTHEMGFARRVCDKVAFLSGGVIKEYGPSGDIFTHPRTPELQRFLSKLSQWG